MVAIVENVKTRLRMLAMQGMSETLMKMLRMLVTSLTMLQQWRVATMVDNAGDVVNIIEIICQKC